MAAARAEMVSGLGHFAAAEGWGQLAFFGFIGFLLFAAPVDRVALTADARFGRAGRPLPDDSAGHHLDVGPGPGPGAGVACDGFRH